jgi:16S rRNA (guanine527-N7)-methyltransferase
VGRIVAISSMDTVLIARLLAPFLERPLDSSALEQISIYIDLLLRWNARINLTAIRDPAQIVTRHFGESLFLARHLFPVQAGGLARSAMGVLDIGSGAGFPGLPLKIWAPEIHLMLIESNHRKAAFLREVSRALTLTNVDVSAERAEALASASSPPPAGIVTLRAVERFEAVVPTAVRFLAPEGRLALLIGSSQVESLARLAPALEWSRPVPIPLSSTTVVSVGSTRQSGKT